MKYLIAAEYVMMTSKDKHWQLVEAVAKQFKSNPNVILKQYNMKLKVESLKLKDGIICSRWRIGIC